MRVVSAIAILIAITPAWVSAELVPSETVTPEVCPVRPPEPPLIANMDMRESHRVILVQRMYRAASYQEIVATGDCSCEKRFPAWDVAVDYYLENYARLQDRYEIQEVTKKYRNSISQNRSTVRDLCTAQEIWD